MTPDISAVQAHLMSRVGHHEVLLQRENVMMTGLIQRFKILVYASCVRGIGIARRFGLQIG